MKLNNQALYDFFTEKGISKFFHANTVATSVTFLEEGGLLSRGAVEKKGLYQTPQTSDRIDKIVNVYDDVFLDSVDLHQLFPRQNYYGPVLFVFSNDFLLMENYDMWITRENPKYWNSEMSDDEKYFAS